MNPLSVLIYISLVVQSTLSVLTLDTCGGTKGCLLFPNTCKGNTCTAAVTWKPSKPGYLNFELAGNAKHSYATVCFSTDTGMADSDCIDCLKTNPMRIQNSYNKGYNNIESATLRGLTMTSTVNKDGQFSCFFERNLNSSGQPESVDLANGYHVLLAVGSVSPLGKKLQHSMDNRMSSPKLVVMTDIKKVKGTKQGTSKLIKAHGALMTSAWLLFATLGMFIARYMKSDWAGKNLMGLPYWFFLHRLFMVIAVLLASAGIALVFIHVKGYSNMSTKFFESHPPIGIAVMTLALINPIMSVFRCEGRDSKRWIFNWAHYLVGNVALILAFVNVYSGYDIIKEKREAQWIIIGYAIFYVFMCFVMEIQKICSRREMNTTNSIEMNATNSTDNNENTNTKPKKKSYTMKHIAFTFFATVTIGVYSVLLVYVLD